MPSNWLLLAEVGYFPGFLGNPMARVTDWNVLSFSRVDLGAQTSMNLPAEIAVFSSSPG